MKTASARAVRNVPAWLAGQGEDADIVTSTRIRVARNLADHRFAPHASAADRARVFEKSAAAISRTTQFRSSAVINFSHIPLKQRQLLIEKRIASPDLLCVEGDCGVVCNTTGSMSVMINEEDHLRVLSIDSGLAPLTLWHSVDEVDDQLGQELQFAFDRTRGFLSCCPTNSGTGLRASFLLHLPGLVLTKAIDAVLQGASQMGIATRGFFGEHSEVVGNYFQLSNQAAMGMSEAGVVEHARLAIAAVVTAERQARVRLMNDAILPLTDKIMRAYGILQYAKTLSVAEYLSIASALRLGSDCGILTEIDSAQLDLAMLCIMPAHVQQCAGRDMDETESSVVRADLARELLLKPVRKRKPRSSHEKQN